MSAAPVRHFVYDVDGTSAAPLMDFLRRLRDPSSCPCRLCDVTYRRFLRNAEWSRFVEGLPLSARFHLRAGFRRRGAGSRARSDPTPTPQRGGLRGAIDSRA